MLRRLLKPLVKHVRRAIWFIALLVLIAWIIEWSFFDSAFVTRYVVGIAFVVLLLSWFLQRRFWRIPPPRNRETRIVIIGAGPAGLSAAYFLKQHGYREVLVLEKLGRVGGLCRTITEDYFCFDLGANYVTPAYRETLALADEVGAELYIERPMITVDFTGDRSLPPRLSTPWQTVTHGISAWRFILLCMKYAWQRFRLRQIIDPPGLERIHRHPNLCVSFLDWLKQHRLQPLQRLFEAPITIMGYGYLHEIPAPYALKYMSLRTFMALALKAFPLTSRWYWWPKRFVLGFQRLWEAVSWTLNVRFNVNIHSITRHNGKIQIEFTHEEQILNRTEPHADSMEFDKLILACPLTHDVLHILQDRSELERELFGKIITESYCLTSFTTEGIELDRPIAAALPLPEIGMPWAITKQMPDSNMFQFYSRVPPEWLELTSAARDVSIDSDKQTIANATRKEKADPVRDHVAGKVREVVERLGGRVLDDQWHTYDRWPYFQHVSAEDMRTGFHERLESLQGERNTYYVGAIMNFELVETSIAYSKHLVKKHFPRA